MLSLRATEECSKKAVLLPANAAEGRTWHLATTFRIAKEPHSTLRCIPDFELILSKMVDSCNERPVVLKVENLGQDDALFRVRVIRRSKGTLCFLLLTVQALRSMRVKPLHWLASPASGKSTTLMQIMDLLKPEDGRITVLGKDVAELTLHSVESCVKIFRLSSRIQ